MIGETTVLVTALRGNGKSLWAVNTMQKEIAQGRAVFASNFKGLRVPGVQELENPREWESLPPGSILFVDEAQRYWRSRRSGDPPPEVQAMETQRHLGITIVLLTQQPTYLDKHVRGLVDLHYHLVRKAGMQVSQVYEWKRCREDPIDNAAQDAADKSVFVFDPKDFALYDSAEVHTIKRKIPLRMKMLFLSVPVIAGLFWWALSRFDTEPAAVASHEGVPAAGGTPTPRDARVSRRDSAMQYQSADDYRAALTPRIPEVIWSAPAFDGRPVVSDPHLYCIAVGHAPEQTCGCYTEQATPHNLDLDKCLTIARHGEPYNPFKPPQDARDTRRSERGAGVAPAAMAAPAAAPAPEAGRSLPAGEPMAAYGGFRNQ